MTSRKNTTIKRAAIYIRVSTDGQTVDNQRLELNRPPRGLAGISLVYMTMTAYPAPSHGSIEKPLTDSVRTPPAASSMWSCPGPLTG